MKKDRKKIKLKITKIKKHISKFDFEDQNMNDKEKSINMIIMELPLEDDTLREKITDDEMRDMAFHLAEEIQKMAHKYLYDTYGVTIDGDNYHDRQVLSEHFLKELGCGFITVI